MPSEEEMPPLPPQAAESPAAWPVLGTRAFHGLKASHGHCGMAVLLAAGASSGRWRLRVT